MSEEITNEPPPQISKAQVNKVLKADLANMVKKVANGKTLSSTERAILTSMAESSPSEPEPSTEKKAFVQKQSELATILGFKDRKTIQRWIKEGGTPAKQSEGYNVSDWIKYAGLKGHEVPGEKSSIESVSQTVAKAKQTLLQNERLEMKILSERGELMPRQIANKVFGKLVGEAKARCFSAAGRFATLAKMAPSVEVASEEIRKEMVLIWKALEDGAWLK